MEQFNSENLHILWLFAVKMFSIWWPIIVAIIIMGIHTYIQERREEAKVRVQKRPRFRG